MEAGFQVIQASASKTLRSEYDEWQASSTSAYLSISTLMGISMHIDEWRDMC